MNILELIMTDYTLRIVSLGSIFLGIISGVLGSFAVIRKQSLLGDAVSHSALPGIAIAFILTGTKKTEVLLLGALISGLISTYIILGINIFLTEMLNSTKLVSEDSAIGIVFPLLFSIAIIIISKYAGSVHLDTDSVLLGELAFAPFNRMIIFGRDIGPKAMYSMGTILILNLLFITIFFKELKIVTFDPALAAVLGFTPTLIHYSLMTVVSITAVGAFESVGSILVIAFMIGPPVTAYLLTDDLKHLIIISSVVGAINGILGYQFAHIFDVSISGSMALMTGIVFFLVFIFAPKKGLVTTIRRRQFQKFDFAEKSLMFHIYNHEGDDNECLECGLDTIQNHLNWKDEFLSKIVEDLKQRKKIFIEDNTIRLTDYGRQYAAESYREIITGFEEKE